MKKIRWWLDPNLGREIFEDEFEIHENASEEEIEYEARQQAFDCIDWGYEEVKEPVTWQEAIQAHLDGKDFRIEYEGKVYRQFAMYKIGCLAGKSNYDIIKRGFDSNMLKEGKFFIED